MKFRFILPAISIIFITIALLFSAESETSTRTAVAGDIAPDIFNYLPLVVKPDLPAPTPTATVPASPTTVPANVQITVILYNPAGNDIDGEYVRIENKGGTAADMTSWTLSDNDSHVYTFPSFTLAAGAHVQVWVKSGTNNATNLYWGSGAPFWNNTGDTAFLRNSGGTLVDSCSYPGGGTQANC